MSDSSADIWAPEADFPTSPGFYRATLDELPTPVIVVDGTGAIVYGNRAMIDIGRWRKADGLNANLLAFLHPDDIEWIADAFLTLTAIEAPRTSWAPIVIRVVSADGEEIPVEVTGADRLGSPEVGGVIYHVRPVTAEALERRIIAGLAGSEPTDALLDATMQLVTAPPLDLAAMLLRRRDDDRLDVVASSDPVVKGAISTARLADADREVLVGSSAPTAFAVAVLDGPLGNELRELGFHWCWHRAVECHDRGDGYRLVALSPVHHASARSIEQRVDLAADLAALIVRQAVDSGR